MVKQTMIIGVFKGSELKYGFYFELKLLIVMAVFQPLFKNLWSNSAQRGGYILRIIGPCISGCGCSSIYDQ